jgi:hypothetical protein
MSALAFLVPLATTVDAAHSSDAEGSAEERGCTTSLFQIFRPCALGFTALALAVALWGYGYKLSLYIYGSDHASHMPVAKLWIEHRNGAVAAVSKLRAKAQTTPVFLALPIPPPQWLRVECQVGSLQRAEAHRAATSGSPIPLRSPPPSNLLL